MKRIMIGFVAAGLLAATVWTASAATTQNWIGGSGTWDNTITANWSGGAVPVNGDTANLNQASAGNLAIAYSATYSLAALTIGNTGGGITTLNVPAGAFPAASTSTLNAGGMLALGGHHFFNPGSPAVFTQNGGNVSVGNYFDIYGYGTYNLNSGTFSGGSIYLDTSVNVSTGGIFNQTGGIVTNTTLALRYQKSTYNMSGGNAFFNGVSLGGGGYGLCNFNHTGGTNTCKSSLSISGASDTSDSAYTLNGGTLNIIGVAYYQTALSVAPRGVFQGYGVVGSMAGYIDNSGRIIADGYGTQRDLDLSSAHSGSDYPSRNTTDNTTNHGWFAVNKGRLILTRVITSGTATINWGEAAGDTSIDLVNSARLSFTGATAGSLTGALFTVDRADVPAGLNKPVGVWTFGGVTCTAATVTFRFDDAKAAALGVPEANLNLWRHNGTTWVDVTATRDNTAKTITSQSLGSWPKATTFFAVAKLQPEWEPPAIQNRAVSNVTTNGATFNGSLVLSGTTNYGDTASATVYVLWGETNGAVSGSWAYTNGWNAGDWVDGSFPSTNINLSADRNYYYIFGAFHSATNVLASSPQYLITAALTVQATDPTGRVNAVDTMTFTVARPVTCTNEAVIVNYTLGGTATNVTDYTIAPVSGAVVIAQGQTSGTIVVSPVYKVDVEKTVVLTLTPGAYAIGSANSATGTLLAVAPIVPTTRTWVGGNGTWDETTTNNWNPKDVPHNGDTVNITSNSAVNLSIDYTAAILVGNGLNALTIGNAAGATNTLTIDGSDLLPTATLTLNAGGAIKQTGGTLSNATSATISGGRLVQNGGLMHVDSVAGGGPSITGGGAWIMSNGVANTRNLTIGPGTFTLQAGVVNDYNITWINAGGVFNQTGGSFTQKANYIYINSGTFNINGGTNAANQFLMGGTTPTLNQTGGLLTVAGNFEMRVGSAVYNLSAGTATFVVTYVGYPATGGQLFNHTGGTLNAGTFLIAWSDSPADCVYRLRGGTLTAGQTVIEPRGVLEGYGTVTFNNSLKNNGRVIADGLGTDTNLDLSTATSILNTTDNTTNRGWFAVNKGRLQLPKLSVSAGSSTINWGEAAADTTIDLVNSARIAFTGATAGSLTGALYSVDRADIPAGLRKPVGVWSFGGVTSTVATLTFRYDDAAATAQGVAEADLRVWKHNGTKWVNITDTRDNTAKTITSLPSVSSGAPTFFAVAPPSSSGTMILIR